MFGATGGAVHRRRSVVIARDDSGRSARRANVREHANVRTMELGLYTFAELTPGRAGSDMSRTVDASQRLRDLLEEIELADQVGLDVFGVGEHHRPDFAVSSPAVVLAAAAEASAPCRTTG
jgi:Luciferase-like monooxygenase